MRAYTDETGALTLLRLPPGSDLYEGIIGAAADLGIRAAGVTAIGALRRLSYGAYDQGAERYRRLEHRGELELASAVGNVSLKQGEPFLHMHVVAGKPDGTTIGGHLFGGEVFVAEVAFQALRGDPPVRDATFAGLDLWPTD